MEKKYIVELYDENVKSVGGYDWLQLLISVADKSVMVKTAIQLLPYTEPRKESCDKCINETEDLAYQLYSSKVDEAYQRGMEDAWDAARKILFNPDDGGMSAVDVNEVFGENSWTVMKDFSASEVVAKIKEYEDSKHKIKVGDEVKSGDEKYIVLQKYLNNIDEPMAVLFNRRDEEISYFHLYNGNGAIFEKTGKHFPEIVEVLAKMKEN